jgi:hypothetical protein
MVGLCAKVWEFDLPTAEGEEIVVIAGIAVIGTERSTLRQNGMRWDDMGYPGRGEEIADIGKAKPRKCTLLSIAGIAVRVRPFKPTPNWDDLG